MPVQAFIQHFDNGVSLPSSAHGGTRDDDDHTRLATRSGSATRSPDEARHNPDVRVAGAIATRDFMPVHHDREYANSQGAPHIFLNIMTDNGYCSRFLTDWAGPEAMVRKIAIRLGVPAYAGSTLEFTGKVTSKSEVDGEGSSRSRSGNQRSRRSRCRGPP